MSSKCLKNVGLYKSFGIGRCSFLHSLLTQARRLANSQASASNAGVPGDPNLPESNCSQENVPQVSHRGQLSAKIKGIKQLSRYSIHDKQVLKLPG